MQSNTWEAVVSHFPDVPLSVPALRRCHHCARAQEEDPATRLRKCAGCSRALYCSKACQKAAWQKHKLVCCDATDFTARNNSGQLHSGLRSLGYSDLATFTNTLQEFMEAHTWALRSLAKAHVLRSGGLDWVLNPPKMLYIFLIPASVLGLSERNPARTFRLKSHGFVSLADHALYNSRAAADWMRSQPTRAVAAELYGRHPLYAGLLPVMFDVEGLNMTFLHNYPLFRPFHPQTLSEPTKNLVLDDILELSAGSINAGLPLRAVEEAGPMGLLFALPGRFVRSQGSSWTWKALFPTWAEYQRGEHQELDETLDKLKAGITPSETMIVFRSL
ncbi:hypothetical protein BD309DRAFT_893661 [Dichomitus squalens]|uniref:Uncharacterized protein n=1 Tax=Dichomitus squalens TaxID=114155 RepID=A0A4Q9PRP7_9APHY|nr:hypothetical protein BD309DRAFT_893661 [Dichomitus squalens]TBU57071.1 hypothetical protein BD310DRAFT_930278 [Dichomitus squalens]